MITGLKQLLAHIAALFGCSFIISSDFLWKSALYFEIWAENRENFNKIGNVSDPGWETNASQVRMWFSQLHHDVMNI